MQGHAIVDSKDRTVTDPVTAAVREVTQAVTKLQITEEGEKGKTEMQKAEQDAMKAKKKTVARRARLVAKRDRETAGNFVKAKDQILGKRGLMEPTEEEEDKEGGVDMQKKAKASVAEEETSKPEEEKDKQKEATSPGAAGHLIGVDEHAYQKP